MTLLSSLTSSLGISGFVIVLLIAGVCLSASFWALRHTHRYQHFESDALQYITLKLKRLRTEAQNPATADKSAKADESAPPKLARGPRDPVDIEALRQGLPAATLMHDRLDLIKRLRDSDVKVNLNALQQMTLARESTLRSLAFPGFAANISMMLGLFGTVVGLTLMLQHIDVALQGQADATAHMLTQVRSALGGMKTAFAATLAGLTSAIWLSWLNRRLAHAQSTFLDTLDRFTTTDLLPATVPSSGDADLLEQVSRQVEASFTRLDELGQRHEKTLGELHGIETTFVQLLQTVRDTTKSETSTHVSALIGRLTDVIGQMATLTQSIHQVTSALRTVTPATANGSHAPDGQQSVSVTTPAVEMRQPVPAWAIAVGLALVVLFGVLVFMRGA